MLEHSPCPYGLAATLAVYDSIVVKPFRQRDGWTATLITPVQHGCNPLFCSIHMASDRVPGHSLAERRYNLAQLANWISHPPTWVWVPIPSRRLTFLKLLRRDKGELLVTPQAGPWVTIKTSRQRHARVLRGYSVIDRVLGCRLSSCDLKKVEAIVSHTSTGCPFVKAGWRNILTAENPLKRPCLRANEAGNWMSFRHRAQKLGPLLVAKEIVRPNPHCRIG